MSNIIGTLKVLFRSPLAMPPKWYTFPEGFSVDDKYIRYVEGKPTPHELSSDAIEVQWFDPEKQSVEWRKGWNAALDAIAEYRHRKSLNKCARFAIRKTKRELKKGK